MSRRFGKRRRAGTPGRVLTLVFGALPATFFCWYAALAVKAGFTMSGPQRLLLVGFGLGGLYGTFALWRVAFGRRTKMDIVGLIVGVAAMLPMLLLSWGGTLGYAAAGPILVALAWLVFALFRRQPDGVPRAIPRRLFRPDKSARSRGRDLL